MARNTNIKIRRSATANAIPSTGNLDLGELALNTYDGKLYLKTTEGSLDSVIQVGSSTDSYFKVRKSDTQNLTVKVVSKTTDHIFHGSGSSAGYNINGVEAPHLNLVPGNRYKFDQSDSSNSGHPLRFYYESNKTTAYTTGVTTVGTPGNAGSYTQIVATELTPTVLHYQCSAHGYMGNAASFNTRNLTGFDTGDLTEGTNLYHTSARAIAAVTGADLDMGGRKVLFGNLYSGEGDLPSASTYHGMFAHVHGTGKAYFAHAGAWKKLVDETTIPALARVTIAVTDNGGDGSLSYNNVTGVIQYTGPSAAEARAHLSGGTGITYNNSTGVITTTDSDIVHDNLSGFASNEHIDHSNVSVIAGAGLLGGGDITTSRTLNVIAGTGITVNANDVAVNMGAFDTDDLSEGSSNLYFTNARAINAVTGSDLDMAGRKVLFGNMYSAEGNLPSASTYHGMFAHVHGTGKAYFAHAGAWKKLLDESSSTTANLTEGSNLYYTNTRARAAISVTDSGGDGSLAYNNSTGVITYTGPSASEVQAHISAGTGVTYSSGAISIGQAVATTSDVQFNDLQVDGNTIITGNLTVNGTQTTLNTATLDVEDLNITVGKLATTSAAANGAGLTFGAWSSGTIPTFVWDHSNSRFTANYAIAANIVGNATTATTLASTRNISGVAFNGSADITLNTSGITENTNLYYTNARADARIGAAVISDLSNVSTTTPSSGQILKWNGSAWAPAADLSGAANQNVYTTVAVSGQTNLVANSVSETLTFAAGANITLTTTPGTDTVTIAAVGGSSITVQEEGSSLSTAASTLNFVGAGVTATGSGATKTITIPGTGTVSEAFKTIAVSGQGNIVADTATDTLTLVAGSNMTLTTNAAGDSITFASSGGGGSNQQSGVWSEYVYTATANQTTFSGSDDNSQTLGYVVGFLQVFLNGILLDNGTDYTASSATSVVLVNSANAGDTLQIATFVKVLGTADITVDTFSGTGSATAFTLSTDPDVKENIQVYIDGVYQEQSTYGTSGTTLTFNTAPPNGTTIEVSIGTRNVTLAELEDISMSGDLSLVDNKKVIWGTGSDLEIYHDGLNSIIKDAGTGHVQVRSGTFTVGNAALSKTSAVFNSGSSQDFYYDNVKKFETTSAGASVTGDLVISGDLTVQGTNTTLNTATLDVEDLNITVGSGASSSSAADGSGLTFGDYTGKATFTWNDSLTSLITNKNLSIGGSNNELRFYEGSNYVGFEAGALSADQIWVLPAADGSSGHALKTDGSGNLSWGLAGGNAFSTISVSGQSNVIADSISDTLTMSGGTGITITTNAGGDEIIFTNSSLGANAFGNIAVSGQSTVVADSTSDTLTLVGQNGVTVTTNAGTDTVTIDGHTSYAPFNTDLFTANGTDTTFVLSSTPSSEDNLIVFVEGVYQNKNSYSLSGSTLTISPAVTNTYEIVVHQIGDVVSGVGLLRNNFTGDGSTAAFTLSQDPLHENNLFVYFDGVYQNKSEFSVSGTTLTFTTAPDSGDAIEVIVPKATEIQTPSVNAIDDAAQFNTNNIIPNTVTTTAVASTSATTIASHAAATYRTVKYLVQCTQGTDYHSTEVNLIHDGSTVYITEYGSLWDNAALGTFDATISGGNILLQITAGSASSMTTKVISTAIPL